MNLNNLILCSLNSCLKNLQIGKQTPPPFLCHSNIYVDGIYNSKDKHPYFVTIKKIKKKVSLQHVLSIKTLTNIFILSF